MEAQDEHVGSNDHTHIVIKGKRTKRQRPSSPFPAAVTSSSSSGCAGGEGGGPGRRGRVDDCYNSISSATTSGEISTEEEEDMANCLIMLAQGQVRPRGQGEEISHKVAKFDDVKVNEVVTATTAAVNKAAAGFYVYECKTCNRSFPSFQALGGHRASHKKPKPVLSPPLKNEFEEGKTNTNSASLCLPAADSHKVYQGANNNKAKIHECSICGSEFSSGQALGGHMRRHRAAAVASAAAASNHVTMSVDDTASTNDSNTGEIKPRSILPLDLNLPAPEDDLHDTKFQFGSTQQALVFSAPALVDCHY